jgi:tripartite ATP-independent transporter DctP family solute receptor
MMPFNKKYDRSWSVRGYMSSPAQLKEARLPESLFAAPTELPDEPKGAEHTKSTSPAYACEKSDHHKEQAMNKCFKRLFFTFLFISSLFLLVGAGYAEDIKERNFKFAFVLHKEHPLSIGAQKFADLVSQKSGGKMKVKLFPAGVLGSDPAVISSLQGGTVEMTAVVPGLVAGAIKEFIIFDFPFLFNNEKEAYAVVDGPVGKKLLDKLPERGLIGLSYWEHGFRNVTNSKRPIAKLEDIQGLKIRVIQISIYVDMFNALGANAVAMPLPEVYTALETKAVDGQENPFSFMEASKFYEVQKYASTTRHMYNPLLVLFSKKIWDQLSNDERKILLDAANEAKPYQRERSREMDVKAIDTVKSKGMIVTEFPPQEIARMREKVKPVTEKYEKEAGEALVKELYAEIEKVRGGK